MSCCRCWAGPGCRKGSIHWGGRNQGRWSVPMWMVHPSWWMRVWCRRQRRTRLAGLCNWAVPRCCALARAETQAMTGEAEDSQRDRPASGVLLWFRRSLAARRPAPGWQIARDGIFFGISWDGLAEAAASLLVRGFRKQPTTGSCRFPPRRGLRRRHEPPFGQVRASSRAPRAPSARSPTSSVVERSQAPLECLLSDLDTVDCRRGGGGRRSDRAPGQRVGGGAPTDDKH